MIVSGGQQRDSAIHVSILPQIPLSFRLSHNIEQSSLCCTHTHTHTYVYIVCVCVYIYIWASLVAQSAKNLPLMQETWVWSLGQEDPLEKEMVTHSSILVWTIPWTEEPGGWWPIELQGVKHNLVTKPPPPPYTYTYICYLLFSRSVMSDSFQPHGLQHTRLPCPSLSPKVCSNSCPLGWWCHPTVSSSVTVFSSCPQSFPASESFPTSQLFTWGGQSIGTSASVPVLPVNIQGWFPLGLTGLICLLSKGLSGVSSRTTIQKHQFSGPQPPLWSNSHIRTWLLEKP